MPKTGNLNTLFVLLLSTKKVQSFNNFSVLCVALISVAKFNLNTDLFGINTVFD